MDCTIQKPKLVHRQSARQALCDNSVSVHGGMEKATFQAQTSYSHTLLLLNSRYCSPNAFCLFTPTPRSNLARMRGIKSGLVKLATLPRPCFIS